jgi:undecaprenyl-diphosphatase
MKLVAPPGLVRAIDHPVTRRIDERIARRVQERRGANPWVDRSAYALSQAANHSVLWHGINAADALVGGTERRRAALRRSIILGVEQAVVNGPLKSTIQRDRPIAGPHEHPLRTPVTSSFPSGHASAGACAATLLSRDLGLAPLWWGLAAGVAWSRVHVGVHHASDVVAGAVVGRTLARLAALIWPARRRSR